MRRKMNEARETVKKSISQDSNSDYPSDDKVNREPMLEVCNPDIDQRLFAFDLHYLHIKEAIQELMKNNAHVQSSLDKGELTPNHRNKKDHILRVVFGKGNDNAILKFVVPEFLKS
jgi:hypothetical protein